MEDRYWDLFWETGSAVFYLMHRQEPARPSDGELA